MMAFRRFLNHVLPDLGDQARLRADLGGFIDRDRRGVLVLCGNGSGSRLMLRVIEEVMGRANVSFLPCCDMWSSAALAGLIDVSVNVVMDLTCGTSWSMYGGLLRRFVVDGVLFDGDVVRAPSMVVYSRFVPGLDVIPVDLAGVATVIEFKVMEKVSFLWSDLAAEVELIRGWVRNGSGIKFRRAA